MSSIRNIILEDDLSSRLQKQTSTDELSGELVSKTQFNQRILAWYHQFGRKHLPWQQNKNAYRVWLSEIMLQQTQVATVMGYFERFIERFPDVFALANASQDEVLHLWTGLGYYARARNLHKTAKLVVEQYQGQFPQDIQKMQALPGIGRSTAAAILASVYKQPLAILDGNVKRTLSRAFAIEGAINTSAVEKQLWQLAERYTPSYDVDHYNQAMMDMGSSVCTRSRPKCTLCPIASLCRANQQGNPLDYPKKKAKKAKPEKESYFLIFHYQGKVWLELRPNKGIWGGLYAFAEQSSDCQQIWAKRFKLCEAKINFIRPLIAFRHTFSHYHLDIFPILIDLNEKGLEGFSSDIDDLISSDFHHQGLWFDLKKPQQIGLAAPVKTLLDNLFNELNDKETI